MHRPLARRALIAALLVVMAAGVVTTTAHATPDDYTLVGVTDLGEAGRVEWSHDGLYLYHDRVYDPPVGDGLADVYRTDADGSNVVCLTCGHPGLPSGVHIGQPAEHPGGRYLVFQVEMTNHILPNSHGPAHPSSGVWCELWVMDLQSQSQNPGFYNVHQLNSVSRFTGGSLHPHFSHDGTQLAWSDREGGSDVLGDWQLAVADFITTDPDVPSIGSIDYYDPGPRTTSWREMAGWSADDSAIYVSTNILVNQDEVDMDIVEIAIPSGAATRLTTTSGTGGENGEWDEFAHVNPAFEDVIAYMSTGDYGTDPSSGSLGEMLAWLQTEVWLMNPDGTPRVAAGQDDRE